MSYAEVTAKNAPPLSEQPHPDPALLNTAEPSAPQYIDGTKKVNVVSGKPRPAGKAHNHLEETKAEGIYLWQSAKSVLLRPGVAGGLIGIVNVGLLVGAARAFYVQPNYRRDTTIISTTLAATFALLGLEGYAAEAYLKTAAGQEEERRAKEEGAMIYRQLKERVLRPGVLGGIVGLMNLGILGTVGYFGYEHWNRPWDRRFVSSIIAGLVALSMGEGFIAEQYRERKL
ncbi:hypothetical protein FB45DRAFT_893472 [Roridomyces roridus]|uniref:Uncharacterized protein n=1 Tax=Roridomyces roridus TaxID=1738132 RepID=A0AAD7CFF2_9AGAR|nr:hypothetical protein FB45DRAFT_893472 [Roridomyces roridus]